MTNYSEVMQDMFTKSRVVILDFRQLDASMPLYENIEKFFADSLKRGINPRLPQERQVFNNRMLESSGSRYLIGRYGEDRVAMLSDTPAGKEGRTIHMAVDIFCKNLEPVFAPCDGRVVRVGYEPGFGEYGNYLIFQPEKSDIFIFFGHLASGKSKTGHVKKGEVFAQLGDHINNENGGWSRHLHLQLMTTLLPEGETPPGYSTLEDLPRNQLLYPDPKQYFPDWKIQ